MTGKINKVFGNTNKIFLRKFKFFNITYSRKIFVLLEYLCIEIININILLTIIFVLKLDEINFQILKIMML